MTWLINYYLPFTDRCDTLCPTLMHFGAKFNLKIFCKFLLDSPITRNCAVKRNRNGDYPHDIARQESHVDLARMLENVALQLQSSTLYLCFCLNFFLWKKYMYVKVGILIKVIIWKIKCCAREFRNQIQHEIIKKKKPIENGSGKTSCLALG